MNFVRQRIALLQCYRALKNLLHSVMLKGHFIIQKYWSFRMGGFSFCFGIASPF